MTAVVAQAFTAEEIYDRLTSTSAGRADPYPLYTDLRQTAPVFRHRSGAWVLTAHADCDAVLRSPGFDKSYEAVMAARGVANWRDHPSLSLGERSVLFAKPADHQRLRGLIARTFTPRAVLRSAPQMQAIADDLVEQAPADGTFDAMAALAFPLPHRTIRALLGVPESLAGALQEQVAALAATTEVTATDEILRVADRAWGSLALVYADLLGWKRRNPGDDVLSHLVSICAQDGERLADDELVILTHTLYVGGLDTTSNLIGNLLHALASNVAQLALLQGLPSLASAAVEETLRWDGSVQLIARTPIADVGFDGLVIPAGSSVIVAVGAANRDPDRHRNPDRFDITRSDPAPLTFGAGPHHCVGATLARMQATTLIGSILRRRGRFTVEAGLERRDTLTLRGFTRLPISFATQTSGTPNPG